MPPAERPPSPARQGDPAATGVPPDGPWPRADPPRSAARRRHRAWDVLVVIALGGGLGSSARYGLARALPTGSDGIPWGTFLANVLGCFVLGLLMVYVLEVWPPHRLVRPFLGVGVLGGFTTFSTYAVEVRGMLAGHRWAAADAYALSSLVAGLAAVWTGVVVARLVARLPVRRGPRRRSASTPPEPAPEPGPGAGPADGLRTGWGLSTERKPGTHPTSREPQPDRNPQTGETPQTDPTRGRRR